MDIAGNQTVRTAELLRELHLPADAVAISGEWGVAKPDPAFFTKVIDMAPGSPEEIVYVGDHRDNDVIPGHTAGLRTALIRRGPWGHLWADDSQVTSRVDWVINSLYELPSLITRTWR